jgi:hypothetical protein
MRRQSESRPARFFRLVVGGLGIALCAGCLSSAPPGRVTASGEIRVNGAPIPDGEIVFESIEDGIGGGVARVGAGGRFEIFLRPSTYRVGVVSVEGGLSPAGFAGVDAAKVRVPPKYAIPARSGIEVKIDAKNRRVMLDLEP